MLYALLALVLALILLLFLSIHIHIVYEDESPAVYLKLLCFKKTLYADTPPSIRKLKKKKSKKEKKKRVNKKDGKTTATGKPPKKKSLAEIRDTVDMILSILSALKDKFLSTLRVTAATVYISVGGDNAAKTALLYGGICQGISYLLEILDNITNLRTVKKTRIHVGCDFSASVTEAEIHLILSMRIGQLLGHALRALKAFILFKLKNEYKNTEKDGNQT